MKRFITMVLAAFFLAGCGKESQTQPVAPAAQVIAPLPIKTHNYSLKDGDEYGYEQGLSVDDTNRGQGAPTLLMAKFAGSRDGKYQVYTKAAQYPGAIIVVECTNPCEFMKSMVFYQGEFVNVQRIRAAQGIIGWAMIEDAINNELEQSFVENNGKKYSLWFDENKGVIKTQANNNTTEKAL